MPATVSRTFNAQNYLWYPMRETNTSISRRKYLTTVAGSSAFVAGCTSTGGSSDETLRVALWSGGYTKTFDDVIKPMFEEEKGVTLETVPKWSEIIAEIRAAPKDNPPYDVTVTDNYYYWAARNGGLLEKLRHDNVPNLTQVYPYLRNFATTEYGAPIDADPMTIVYKDKLGWEPKRWDDLLDDRAKNVAMEGGFYPYSLLAGAIMVEPTSRGKILYDKQYHDKIFETLREIDISMWYGGGQEMWTGMREGVVDMAQYYYSFAKSATMKSDRNPAVSQSLPDITPGYFDYYCVVRGTDKRDLGEQFINFMLRKDVQTKWAKNYDIALANKNATYPDEVGNELPNSNEEYKKIAFPDFSELSQFQDKLVNRWNTLKQE